MISTKNTMKSHTIITKGEKKLCSLFKMSIFNFINVKNTHQHKCIYFGKNNI